MSRCKQACRIGVCVAAILCGGFFYGIYREGALPSLVITAPEIGKSLTSPQSSAQDRHPDTSCAVPPIKTEEPAGLLYSTPLSGANSLHASRLPLDSLKLVPFSSPRPLPTAALVSRHPPQWRTVRSADCPVQEPGEASAPGLVVLPARNPVEEPAFSRFSATSSMPFSASPSPFSLCKIGTGKGPTLLIIGGIQGDEPGGFSAAALIASHYRITSGSVWIVPDLNFPSILERNRGLFGDMNRKFAALDASDPEYERVKRIKSVLLDPQVDLVLNLHDGSGFYRPTWEDGRRNPKRWGQSVIIDQERMPVTGQDTPFAELQRMAAVAEQDVNSSLLDPGHRYHTHNTNTRLGDKEMEKTLSYFAVCNGKPAFGVEASKEFTTEFRSYYHLQVIESFMRQMGIAYKRDFPLTPQGIRTALNSNLHLAAYNNKLILHLDNIRPNLHLVPFDRNAQPEPRASKPLLAIVPEKNIWRVAYGNRTLTRLNPAFMDFDDSLSSVEMLLDGVSCIVPLGEVVAVEKSFEVRIDPQYRVNAIGAQKEKNGSEAGVRLVHKDFQPRFSVDKAGTTYRVEVYKGKAFVGMLLVRFGKPPPKAPVPLTATSGPESPLGF